MIRRMLFTVVQSAVRFLLTAGALTQPCLADPLQWQVNGHFYDVINQNISWQGANAAAASMGFNGMSGHLVTVTSARENVWLTDTFGANRLHLHWLGGFQTTGSPEPGGGWGWITGEPWSFTNWWPGEPNNLDQAFGGNEDALIFDHGTTASGKGWNDLNQNNPEAAGYVVEFEQSTGQAGAWVPISGHLRAADGTPICAMVLANGQYTFSCDGTGAYDLTVPRDGKGQITLFGFADGFAPLGVTLGSGSFPLDLQMPTAASNSSQITMTRSVTCSGTADWVRITGVVLSAGNQPLCAMVLANGQHLFSCGINPGTYDLAAPVARNGQMTIFAFADGFQPYRDTFIAPVCGGSKKRADAMPFMGRQSTCR